MRKTIMSKVLQGSKTHCWMLSSGLLMSSAENGLLGGYRINRGRGKKTDSIGDTMTTGISTVLCSVLFYSVLTATAGR